MAVQIRVSEVGPRDGLQNLGRVVPTDVKRRWIEAEWAAGVPEIEVGSFEVHVCEIEKDGHGVERLVVRHGVLGQGAPPR